MLAAVVAVLLAIIIGLMVYKPELLPFTPVALFSSSSSAAAAAAANDELPGDVMGGL